MVIGTKVTMTGKNGAIVAIEGPGARRAMKAMRDRGGDLTAEGRIGERTPEIEANGMKSPMTVGMKSPMTDTGSSPLASGATKVGIAVEAVLATTEIKTREKPEMNGNHHTGLIAESPGQGYRRGNGHPSEAAAGTHEPSRRRDGE